MSDGIRYFRPRAVYLIELSSPVEDSLNIIVKPLFVKTSERAARQYCKVKNAAELADGSSWRYSYTKLDVRK